MRGGREPDGALLFPQARPGHAGIDSGTLQWLDRTLGDAVLGNAAGYHPPVVKNFRNMSDEACMLAYPKHELEVLDPVKVGVKAADINGQ